MSSFSEMSFPTISIPVDKFSAFQFSFPGNLTGACFPSSDDLKKTGEN